MASTREAMLSLQKCRSLLGPNCELTDSQIDQLRQELYALAHIALDAHRESTQPANENSPLEHLPRENREQAEERAAIFEFDAGLPREAAERKAIEGMNRRPRSRR
jgi:hypothetical protein